MFLLILVLSLIFFPNSKSDFVVLEKTVSVVGVSSEYVTVMDSSNVIYEIKNDFGELFVGDKVVVEYTGIISDDSIIDIIPVSNDEENIIRRSNDGIFSKFSSLASKKIESMSLDEKIGQMLLVKYSSSANDAIKNYNVGGFVFFEDNFLGKDEDSIINMISTLQKNSNIPLLTAVDEEGGSVVRVSSNSNLISSPFKSSKELYLDGGFELIKNDTLTKSFLLKKLGLNVNLAPVVDVSIDSNDYIYDRTLGESTSKVSEYAKTVINASKNTGVSYVLKHFPGYGNNDDSHLGEVIDNRSLSEIEVNDLPPFEEGIKSGAEAILVSHNIVINIDSSPASLSSGVHNLLRQDLGFTGIIMTDDLSMNAVSSIDDVIVKAILAGNDILMVTDYEESFKSIKDSILNGRLSEELIDNAVHRIISWKYYKGLFYDK